MVLEGWRNQDPSNRSEHWYDGQGFACSFVIYNELEEDNKVRKATDGIVVCILPVFDEELFIVGSAFFGTFFDTIFHPGLLGLLDIRSIVYIFTLFGGW